VGGCPLEFSGKSVFKIRGAKCRRASFASSEVAFGGFMCKICEVYVEPI